MAAGNAIIGALRVVLGADTAQFEAGLKAAHKQLSAFGAGVSKAGAVAFAAFATAGVAVGVAVKGAINEADKLGKMAQSVGVPVEQLSGLAHAADLSGVSIESLGKGLGKLSRNMVDAAAKPAGEAANAFRALGISVTDGSGKLKSSSDVLSEVAGKFAGLQDGAGKTAVSIALFGRAGAELIPLLNSGKDGLQGMVDEARQLGIVIDNETAKSAEAFNDNLTRLGKVKDGIILRITAGMLPQLENLSNAFVQSAKNTELMNGAAKVLGTTLQVLASVAVAVGGTFTGLGQTLWAVSGLLANIASGNFTQGWETFRKEIAAVGTTASGTAEILKSIWTTKEIELWAGDAGIGGATKKLKEFQYGALGGKNALDQFIESQKKAIVAQQAELATVGMAVGEKEKLKVINQGLQIASANTITVTDQLRASLNAVGNEAGNVASKLHAAQLIQQSLSPHEAFRQEIANNEVALLKFGATAEQIAAVQERTAERYGNTWGQVGVSVAGSFKQIGDTFAKESKSMAMVAKIAGIAQATISMFVGAAKALELPFPANLAAWATVLAHGASALAGIKGVNAGGFATGGSFKVPGGIGGGDKVRAMVNLEPGEQVDVWRPDQGGPDPRRGGTTVVRVQAPDVTREFIGALIGGINKAVREGYRLELEPA